MTNDTHPLRYLLNASQMLDRGQNGLAMAEMEAFAEDLASDGFPTGEYQDDVSHLNEKLPEFNVEWPMLLPGTQLVDMRFDRDGDEGVDEDHPQGEEYAFVTWSDAPATDLVEIMLENGQRVTINLEETDWEEAGQ